MKYKENETPEFLEYMQKVKLLKRCFRISVVLLFTFVVFTWVSIQIYDLYLSIPDYVGVAGTLIFVVLSLVFLKKYYKAIEKPGV